MPKDSIIVALAGLAFLGMTCAAVGVYCIYYYGDRVLGLGILLEMIGLALAIISFGSIGGIALTYY